MVGLLDYAKANTPKPSGKPITGLIGELWRGFGNNPRNQETVDAMKGMLGLIPLGPGDVAAGALAADDVRRGDYTSAALNSVGMLPYVPALGGIFIGKGAKTWDVLSAGRRDGKEIQGIGSATHEAIPGQSTNHVPEVLGWSDAEKRAYSAVGRWDAGKEGLDAIYRAIGVEQLPPIPSVGAYTNSALVLEHNPMTIARPSAYMSTSGQVGKTKLSEISGAERFRAANDAQEAGAAHWINTGGFPEKSGVLLDSSGNTLAGVQPTAAQLANVLKLLEREGLSDRYFATASNRGLAILPMADDPARLKTMLRFDELAPELQAIFPSKFETGVPSTVYVPGIGKWGEAGVIPTLPFSGEATTGVLQEFAGLNPGVARKLSGSQEVREILRQKTTRDAALQHPREDIQNMRRFFSESDWSRAVELIRKGMSPTAAVAAPGYSLTSLAQEQ